MRFSKYHYFNCSLSVGQNFDVATPDRYSKFKRPCLIKINCNFSVGGVHYSECSIIDTPCIGVQKMRMVKLKCKQIFQVNNLNKKVLFVVFMKVEITELRIFFFCPTLFQNTSTKTGSSLKKNCGRFSSFDFFLSKVTHFCLQSCQNPLL